MTNREPDIEVDSLCDLVVPNNIAQAVKIERIERRKDFKALRKEIERVAMYGANNTLEKSYHTIHEEGGITKVLFMNQSIRGLGKCYNVVANYESSDSRDGRYLDVYEYLATADADLIASSYTWLHRNHHEHVWKSENEDHGPVVGLMGGEVKIHQGKNYERMIPTADVYNFEEVLWRRDDALDLGKLLSRLNEVSCEEIIV